MPLDEQHGATIADKYDVLLSCVRGIEVCLAAGSGTRRSQVNSMYISAEHAGTKLETMNSKELDLMYLLVEVTYQASKTVSLSSTWQDANRVHEKSVDSFAPGITRTVGLSFLILSRRPQMFLQPTPASLEALPLQHLPQSCPAPAAPPIVSSRTTISLTLSPHLHPTNHGIVPKTKILLAERTCADVVLYHRKPHCHSGVLKVQHSVAAPQRIAKTVITPVQRSNADSCDKHLGLYACPFDTEVAQTAALRGIACCKDAAPVIALMLVSLVMPKSRKHVPKTTISGRALCTPAFEVRLR